MAPVRKQRQTGGKSQLLEHAVDTFHMVGFQVYRGFGEFQRAQVVGDRYVIRNYPHPSLYGTPGKKEALIVVTGAAGPFVPDADGRVSIIVEAKWQQGSGSVDEKLPYVWEAFLASDVPNWIVIIDGPAWKSVRGKAAVTWLTARAADVCPDDHVFIVTDRLGFIRFARSTWGAAAA